MEASQRKAPIKYLKFGGIILNESELCRFHVQGLHVSEPFFFSRLKMRTISPKEKIIVVKLLCRKNGSLKVVKLKTFQGCKIRIQSFKMLTRDNSKNIPPV